jgi:hypothetical protein
MSVEGLLGMWLALTLTVGYLGTVILFTLLVPRLVRWVINQYGDQGQRQARP